MNCFVVANNWFVKLCNLSFLKRRWICEMTMSEYWRHTSHSQMQSLCHCLHSNGSYFTQRIHWMRFRWQGDFIFIKEYCSVKWPLRRNFIWDLRLKDWMPSDGFAINLITLNFAMILIMPFLHSKYSNVLCTYCLVSGKYLFVFIACLAVM